MLAFQASAAFKRCAIICGLGLSLSQAAGAAPITNADVSFEKIVEVGPAADFPGITFMGFNPPIIDDGTVYFRGSHRKPGFSRYGGIYSWNGGKIVVLVDGNTLVPGGNNSTFEQFGAIDASNGSISFEARTSQKKAGGIYLLEESGISIVADTHTLVPGSKKKFKRFNDVNFSAGGLLFVGGRKAKSGIYFFDGNLRKVADTKSALPGITGKIIALINPVALQENFIFLAYPSSHLPGLLTYKAMDGSDGPPPRLISTMGDSITRICCITTNQETTAFIGYSTATRGAVYLHDEGQLRVIVDSNTKMPSFPVARKMPEEPKDPEEEKDFARSARLELIADSGFNKPGPNNSTASDATHNNGEIRIKTFDPNNQSWSSMSGNMGQLPESPNNFFFLTFGGAPGDLALDGKRLLFTGFNRAGKSGIYLYDDGKILKIIDTNDLLFDQSIKYLAISSKSLAGDKIVFWAQFDFPKSSEGYDHEILIQARIKR